MHFDLTLSLKIFLGIAAAFAVPIALLLLGSKIHIAKIKAMVLEFPLDKHFDVLTRIDQFSPDISTACLLIDSGRKTEAINYLETNSYVGGTPYMEVDDTQKLEPEYEFLMQFKVPAWIPSNPWIEDLLTVFVNDIYVQCFRYTDPKLEKASKGSKNFAQAEAALLTEVRIPRIPHGQKFRNIYNPRLLLSKIPELRTDLPSNYKKPEKFLASL